MSASPWARWAAFLISAGIVLLTGCAVTGADTAADTGADDAQPTVAIDPSATIEPGSTPPESPSEPTESSGATSTGAGGTLPVGDAVTPGQALIVSASNVDVATQEVASALVDDQSIEAFLATMDPQLGTSVRAAVTGVEVPANSTLFGAVVTVGCETPTVVSWEDTSEGVRTTAVLPKSNVQCLVPVTSVALFLVPGAG